jgi:hypothetical protein
MKGSLSERAGRRHAPWRVSGYLPEKGAIGNRLRRAIGERPILGNWRRPYRVRRTGSTFFKIVMGIEIAIKGHSGQNRSGSDAPCARNPVAFKPLGVAGASIYMDKHLCK